MLQAYPDSFVALRIHVSDEYATSWGHARADFFDVGGKPNAWFDGVLECDGVYHDAEFQFAWYEDQHIERQEVPTDVTIAVGGEQVDESLYNVFAQVCVEPGGEPRDMRVHIAQVLDYWPVYGMAHRNGFKQAASHQDIALLPGQCETIERELTFDDESWDNRENIKLVAWAQEIADLGPAEVYQATWRAWPFSIAGDHDGNGLVDIADYTVLHACLAGPGEIAPTHCTDVFDFDGDLDIDLVDCAGFMERFSPGESGPTGDYDGDGLVNAVDYTVLYACLAGPGEIAPPDCTDVFDFDGDLDIDLVDCAGFMERFSPGESGPTGDYDGDGLVNAVDYTVLHACLAGPAETAPPDCTDVFDFDGDLDIDLVDCAGFLQRFTEQKMCLSGFAEP